ncbi:hypothetical protein M514_02761 [Trichuris suis]|uniref:Uncharacterized protein n=1 Tax=Trichuris suis TaxID=68888 RepID=A0A085MGG0_9BILA|nr:hypothetical protein M513_02761 [Trichuris suis]KFD68763.1 hypothetical protein M514_02761 [Trichuris suis]
MFVSPSFLPVSVVINHAREVSAVPIPHLNSQPIIFLEDFAQFSSIPMAEGVQRGEGFRKTMEALFRDSFRESNYAHGHGIKAPIAVKWLDARKDQSENMQRVYGLWDPIDAMIDKKTEHLVLQG